MCSGMEVWRTTALLKKSRSTGEESGICGVEDRREPFRVLQVHQWPPTLQEHQRWSLRKQRRTLDYATHRCEPCRRNHTGSDLHFGQNYILQSPAIWENMTCRAMAAICLPSLSKSFRIYFYLVSVSFTGNKFHKIIICDVKQFLLFAPKLPHLSYPGTHALI